MAKIMQFSELSEGYLSKNRQNIYLQLTQYQKCIDKNIKSI